jgi:gentisate 1,2-dioxygenase
VTKFFVRPETTPARAEFNGRLSTRGMAPLWEVLGEIVPPQPRPKFLPAIWRYGDVRPMLIESGGLITADEAERRVLILENPALRGGSQITQSLYAGFQLVMPDETAPTHRHVASALRFVIESEGGYTAVDGHRVAMHPGDLILTPSWTYHDHGNPGGKPVIWLDVLDIPTVNFFDTSFAERYPSGESQPGTKDADPWFAIPYLRSRTLMEQQPLDPRHGRKMEYRQPTPTIGAFLQLLPEGFQGARYRSTDATVFCVMEGRGSSHIGETVFAWEEHDVFVVPSWFPVSHAAETEAVLFSFSDRPTQKALGLWREE